MLKRQIGQVTWKSKRVQKYRQNPWVNLHLETWSQSHEGKNEVGQLSFLKPE